MVRPSRLAMLGAAGVVSSGSVPRQPQLGLVARRSCKSRNVMRQKMLAAEAVVSTRGLVGGEERCVVAREDEHRHRIAVEQQPERGLALLQVGDVDAQADDAAVAGAAAPRSGCSGRRRAPARAACRVVEQREPLRDPFLLAPDRGRIVAARDADAQRVFEPCAGFEQVGAALVDVGILLVPQDVAALASRKTMPCGRMSIASRRRACARRASSTATAASASALRVSVPCVKRSLSHAAKPAIPFDSALRFEVARARLRPNIHSPQDGATDNVSRRRDKRARLRTGER